MICAFRHLAQGLIKTKEFIMFGSINRTNKSYPWPGPLWRWWNVGHLWGSGTVSALLLRMCGSLSSLGEKGLQQHLREQDPKLPKAKALKFPLMNTHGGVIRCQTLSRKCTHMNKMGPIFETPD